MPRANCHFHDVKSGTVCYPTTGYVYGVSLQVSWFLMESFAEGTKLIVQGYSLCYLSKGGEYGSFEQ